jgi:hypothetical protein
MSDPPPIAESVRIGSAGGGTISYRQSVITIHASCDLPANRDNLQLI